MLETFTRDTFAPHLDQRFQLEHPGGMVEIELVELTDLSSKTSPQPPPQRVKRVPFSIVFRGPRDPILVQQIFKLSHSRLGEFELFLVPIGRDANGTRYEAVFT